MPSPLSQAQPTGARAADLPLATVKYWNNHKKKADAKSSPLLLKSPSQQLRDAGCRRAGPFSEINETRHAPSGPCVPACPTAGTELDPLPPLAPQQPINCLFVYLKGHTVDVWSKEGGGGECLETWGSLSLFLSFSFAAAGSAGHFISTRSMAAKSQL